MKFEYIVGYHNFWTFLFKEASNPTIDENISMQLPRGSFSVNKSIIHCTHFVDTLHKFNEMFGTRFVPEESKFGGQTYFNIAMLEEGESYAVQQKETSNVEAETKNKQEEEEEVVSSEVKVAPVLDEEKPTDEEKVPDWDWINSLGNDKDSKESFDVYAEEEFGIKLKRNMKIENMRAKFKEALDK